MVQDALRRSDVDAVTLVHSETATGALAPLTEIAKVVRERNDVLLLVDAVTSMAGCPIETDQAELDFVFTGSQKALGLPPGLALGVCSDRLIDRAKTVPNRGGYLDILAYHDAFAKRQPTNTPAISLLYALETQLARIERSGGIDERRARLDAMRGTIEEWVEGKGGVLGYSFLPRPGRRSWTVSCLNVPEGKNGRVIAKAAGRRGWTIGTGYGALKESTIRIGHMGDHSVEGVRELLSVIEGVTA
jgi:aspartate aminotransferase-like enzyme